MHLKFYIVALLTLLAFSGCFDNHPKADLVIFNGNIYTVNSLEPKAEAIAVANGKIVYVGNNVNANNWVADSTIILDIEGKTLVPGFIEGHGHLMNLGEFLRNLDLTETKIFDEIITKVEYEISNIEKGEWLVGRGWHQDKWEVKPDTLVDGFPLHDSLSKVSPNNPILLIHASGHAAIVNEKALQLAGISDDTENPPGGIIVRNDEGVATGVLLENAIELVRVAVPKLSDENKIEAIHLALEECLKNGITSFHTAGSSQKSVNLFHSFLKNELLKIRLYIMINGLNEELVGNWFTHGPSIGLGNDFLTIRSIKLVADGALGSRGALLLEDYADSPDEQGQRISELDYLMRITSKAYEKGFQICTHAIGDRANREMLDLYEIVLNSDTTKADPRFRIEHAQHISSEDIPRFGELGVIPSMQSIHMSSDRPWAIDRLGQERIEEGAYVWRKLIDTGAKVMNGTDTPVEPINPIANFYAAVSRQTLEGTPEGGFEPDQKMTREEALNSMTLNNAFGAFEENIKGSIEVDKLADFTILSKDIMEVPIEEILSTEIEYTIVDGKVEYKKQAE